MQKLTAKVDTFLKRAPIAAALSPLQSVKPIASGESISVDRIRNAPSKHNMVDLSYGQGAWFIFSEHWDGLQNQLVSKATAEHIIENDISDELLADLNTCCDLFEINTPERLRHFLSQIAHESGALQYFEELGDRAYFSYLEGRAELGNVNPGDGYKFRGAGCLQVTGRNNQTAFGNFIKDPQVERLGTDYVAKKYPFQVSGYWWAILNGVNKDCDRGATVEQITRIVNGGVNGLADREKYYRRCCDVI